MLTQLRLAGAFEGVRGVVFGEMKGCAPRGGGGLHPGGGPPRGARRPRRADRASGCRAATRTARTCRCPSGFGPASPAGRRVASRSSSRRSREGPPLRGLRHRHGLPGGPPAGARPRGHGLRPGRLPADVHPARGARASPVRSPYAEANVPEDADLVVIGNALSRGNPEVEVVLDRRQRYTSLPALLAEEFIRGRTLARGGGHPRQDHDHEPARLHPGPGRARARRSSSAACPSTSAAATGWAAGRPSWSKATSTTARSSTSGRSSSTTCPTWPSSATSSSTTPTSTPTWRRSRPPSGA